jgi:hypothetical protein
MPKNMIKMPQKMAKDMKKTSQRKSLKNANNKSKVQQSSKSAMKNNPDSSFSRLKKDEDDEDADKASTGDDKLAEEAVRSLAGSTKSQWEQQIKVRTVLNFEANLMSSSTATGMT